MALPAICGKIAPDEAIHGMSLSVHIEAECWSISTVKCQKKCWEGPQIKRQKVPEYPVDTCEIACQNQEYVRIDASING
jgi:hypothetical protein